jgi:hypothetical protein
MNRKINCWEFKKCGREPAGAHAAEFGICPASVEQRLDGIHGGHNAGRACWAIAGTFCEGQPQGTFVDKYASCTQCDFYELVFHEEGPGCMMPATLLAMLQA